MDENLLGAYNYAINSGNVELFDVLAKDFDKLKKEDKNLLFEKTVVYSPSVEFIQWKVQKL